MATLLKNPNGGLVVMADSEAEFLLSEKPTQTLANGKKLLVQKTEDQKGWKLPTIEEEKEYFDKAGKKDISSTSEDNPGIVLVKVKGIGKQTAASLVSIGIKTVEELKERFYDDDVKGVIGGNFGKVEKELEIIPAPIPDNE